MAVSVKLVVVLLAMMALAPCCCKAGVTHIPASEKPCLLGAVLEVKYKGKGDIMCGDTVELEVVKDATPPKTVTYEAAESNLYTLMMVDPDAPSREKSKGSYFLHWLITNIKGGDLLSGGYTSGNVIADYHPPAPPAGSGPHRYQFFVFSQPGRLSLNTPITGRVRFDVKDFQNTNKLEGPLAGYQFFTESK